ncbi:histidine ammonia-lyase [Clostridium estertheticum]|uniref:histidine ammonia-lyase n=1 Tax=Clostridium estertheticum TaxID=238834 RepID=UPI0013E99949|nr:histidine ammonia-lyase [Clostridium estertheticum]MBZ9686820.1 histidine ammonia-lyase [Clostridium estertheticum]
MIDVVMIDGNTLTLCDVIVVAREGAEIQLSQQARENINKSRRTVEKFIEDGKVIYGINTGFGKFSEVAISKEEIAALQRNLIFSDAVGAGNNFDIEVVRAIMLLRINALAKGYSGIKLETVETLIAMLNKKVHPLIREQGSVGASGDLCPLAHMVLVMLGEGEAEYNGKVMDGKSAMEMAQIPVTTLEAKEGLALINGTCAMTAVATLAVYDAFILLKSADVVAALTFEALEGIIDAFDEKVHMVRPHKGQIISAQNMRNMCEGSKLVTKQGEKRVQDAYTLRCIPQIHGASRPAMQYAKEVVEIEINSATDNPLIFSDENEVISGGNFHGQPIAIAMDTLGIATAELADVSERRIERLLNPALNDLPAFLTPIPGLNCGFMVAQYAAASLVSENKILAHPASVDSIPTCANQEDHVSFGTIGARKARQIIKHVQRVLGTELACAAQAVDFKDKDKLGIGSAVVYSTLRKKVAFMKNDRILYKEIDICQEIIQSGELLNEVEKVIGKIQ